MASGDAKSLPIYGVAHAEYGWGRSSSTGQVITGGIGSLAVTGSLDGGAFASTGLTITETPASSGQYRIDIDATRMTCNHLGLKITGASMLDETINVYPSLYYLPATDATNKAVLIQEGTGYGQLVNDSGKVELAATGLDAISATAPTAAGATTFPKRLLLAALYATGAVVVTDDDVKLYDTVGGTLLGTGAITVDTTPGSESTTKGALA